MQLAGGIPTLSALDALKQTDLYARHVDFNREFLKKHASSMEKYGLHWGLDPFKLWSRRWEYPFVGQRLTTFGERGGDRPLSILDAGSGVTYFPYFLSENLPNAQIICCDYNLSYARMFDEINRDRKETRVSFRRAMLQQLPLEDGSVDAICCISVLEHTDNYDDIVKESARVLRSGGMFVLTFDLSLDGKFTLPKPLAAGLLNMLSEKFVMPDGFDPLRELERMNDNGILSTDHVRATEPQLLPWSKPVRVYKALQDLFQGRGWTCGFRSRTVYCIDLVKN
jgi:SAM-dependent methyltransferase